MHADGQSLNDLSGRIIGCAFTVLNALGAGFAEKIYENALAHELRKAGLATVQQRSVTALNDDHRGQCMNYVKATGLRLCLLLNFGNPRLEIKRIAFGL